MPAAGFAVTLGPACNSPQNINNILSLNPLFFRINFAHGSFANNLSWVRSLRSQYPSMKIYADIKGGQDQRLQIYNGDKYIDVEENTRVVIYRHPVAAKRDKGVFLAMPQDICVKQQIGVNDCKIILNVVEVSPECIIAAAQNSGAIRNNDSATVDNTSLSQPPTDAQTLKNIAILNAEVDGILLSHIKGRQDIVAVKQVFCGDLVAKIETTDALDNLEQIAEESPSLLIARGDLSMVYSPQQLPVLQHLICSKLRNYPRLYLATGFFDSMRYQDTPHFADIMDVYHSHRQGIRGFLLTAETAIGRFPVSAVQKLQQLLQFLESQPSCLDFTGKDIYHANDR